MHKTDFFLIILMCAQYSFCATAVGGLARSATVATERTAAKTIKKIPGVRSFALSAKEKAGEGLYAAKSKIDDVAFKIRAKKTGKARIDLADDELRVANQNFEALKSELSQLEEQQAQHVSHNGGLHQSQRGELAGTDEAMLLADRIRSVESKVAKAEQQVKNAEKRYLQITADMHEKAYKDLFLKKNSLKKDLARHEKILQKERALKAGGSSQAVIAGVEGSKKRIQQELYDTFAQIRSIENQKAQRFEATLPKIEIPLGNSAQQNARLLKPLSDALSTKEGRLFLRTETGRKWLQNNHTVLSNSQFIRKWLKDTPDGIQFQFVNQSNKFLDSFFNNSNTYKFFTLPGISYNDLMMLREKFSKIPSLDTDGFLSPEEINNITLAQQLFDFQKKVLKVPAYGADIPQRDVIKSLWKTDLGKELLKSSKGQEWLRKSNGQAWLDTEDGQAWLQTPDGAEFLQKFSTELRQMAEEMRDFL